MFKEVILNLGKKASRMISKNKSNNLKSNKSNSNQSEEKRKQLEEKLLELTDKELEALFEMRKIDQTEYEYILAFRKKQKARKKSDKEKFEERIRCNNSVIQKVVNLGRKFRLQEIFSRQGNTKRSATQNENYLEEEQDIEREERLRESRK